ncbi:TPA: VRR-NUC domain-containing protein [Escherichia coli]|nr:VRR-NUC domain-containing protein [Escherichia coli]
MLRFTEEEFQAFSERRNKGGSRPKTKKDPFLSLAPVKEVSPHAKALAALAKNPDLRDGNCEHFEQVFIFDYFERKHPDIYELLHATPNGGKRSKSTAGKMKAEGQKKGYPDMSLDKACGIYHGMRIELKEPNGKAPTKEQIAWMRRLREEGYYVVLAYGAEQAITAILEYISLKKGEAIEHVLNGDKWLYAA